MTGVQGGILPTYGECDSCGAPNGVIYLDPPYGAEHLCSPCAQRRTLFDGAYGQLEALLRESTQAWFSIWGGVFPTPDFDEHFRQIGGKLQNEYEATREGVRSFPLSRAA